MENGPFEDDVPLENGDIPLLFIYQRVPWTTTYGMYQCFGMRVMQKISK